MRIDKYCNKVNNQKMYMWGLMMSGEMNIERIQVLFPDMIKKASKNNRNLEILLHPGYACDEYKRELNKGYYEDFNSSLNRKIEKSSMLALKSLKDKYM